MIVERREGSNRDRAHRMVVDALFTDVALIRRHGHALDCLRQHAPGRQPALRERDDRGLDGALESNVGVGADGQLTDDAHAVLD